MGWKDLIAVLVNFRYTFQNSLEAHRVAVATIFLILCASVDNVMFLRLIKQMGNYTFPLSQMIYPLCFSVATFVISLMVYRDRIFCLSGIKRWSQPQLPVYRYKMDEEDHPVSLEYLEPEPFDESQDSVQVEGTETFSILRHWKIIAIFATIDTLSSVAAIFPLQYLPSIILLFMGQLGLPLNLFLSRFVLKVNFATLHYYAAGVVILGVMIASYSSGTTATATVSTQPMDIIIFWSLWLLIIHLVSSYLAIYRERKIKELNLKPWHTVVWISAFQLPMSILCMAVIFLPLPEPFKPIAPSEFGQYIQDAFQCLGGKLPECEQYNNLLLFGIFMVFNIITNLLGMFLVKLRSSNFVITVGIINMIFKAAMLTNPTIAGAAYQSLTFLHLIGFSGILLGILIYNYVPVEEFKQSPKEDPQPQQQSL